MRLKKILATLLIAATPLTAVSCVIPLAISAGFVVVDSKNNFRGAKRFASNLNTSGSKKEQTTKDSKNNIVDVSVFNHLKSSNYLLDSLENTFRVYSVSNRSLTNKNLNKHRNKNSALLLNLYNLKIQNKINDKYFDYIFKFVYGFDKFNWWWTMSKQQAKQFLKTYLGSYIMMSFFSSYDVSNWYNQQIKLGTKFNEKRPEFLNKNVLTFVEKNEQQKNLLKQLYGNLNNWYANLESDDIKTVTFSLANSEVKEKFNISSLINRKNFEFSSAVSLNKNNKYKFSQSRPNYSVSKSEFSNNLFSKAQSIQKNGDKVVAVIPTSFLKTLTPNNNNPFVLEGLSKTFLGYMNLKNEDVSTIFEASEFGVDPQIKMFERDDIKLSNYLVNNREILNNYLRKYSALTNVYKASDKIIETYLNAVKNLGLKDVLFNKQLEVFSDDFEQKYRRYNYYFKLTKDEDFLFLVASEKSRDEFFSNSTPISRYFDYNLNDINFYFLLNTLWLLKNLLLI